MSRTEFLDYLDSCGLYLEPTRFWRYLGRPIGRERLYRIVDQEGNLIALAWIGETGKVWIDLPPTED